MTVHQLVRRGPAPVPEPDPIPRTHLLDRLNGSDEHYGRRICALGEDGDVLLVEGHDRHSAAAISKYLRDEYGLDMPRGKGAKFEPGWALIHTTCGCSELDHARHTAVRDLADLEMLGDLTLENLRKPLADGLRLDVNEVEDLEAGVCPCRRPGLPPCSSGEQWSWYAVRSAPDVDGAIPVLWVTLVTLP